jgi:hypothetical protein
MTVEMEGEFVVFLIGLRVNKPWKLHKWVPALLAMPRMLKELDAHPEAGCLAHSGFGPAIVQYWRSFEHLEAYARAKDKKHWPAWVDFNRRVGGSRGDVGIWHETYIVNAKPRAPAWPPARRLNRLSKPWILRGGAGGFACVLLISLPFSAALN